ncbi:MAG: fructose 1,6-bisphosphatase [Candidatus Omnitrophota bacterium]
MKIINFKNILKLCSMLLVLTMSLPQPAFALKLYDLRPRAAAEAKTGEQFTAILGEVTDRQTKDIKNDTKMYLRKAGNELRIITIYSPTQEQPSVEDQLREYNSMRTTRQLPPLEEPDLQLVIGFVEAVKAFVLQCKSSISHQDIQDFGIRKTKKALTDDIDEVRIALVIDESGTPAADCKDIKDKKIIPFEDSQPFFVYLESDVEGIMPIVVGSAGTHEYKGFRTTRMYERGDDPESMYLPLSLFAKYKELHTEGKQASVDTIIHEYLDIKAKEETGMPYIVQTRMNDVNLDIVDQWKKDQEEKRITQTVAKKDQFIAEERHLNLSQFFAPKLSKEGAVLAKSVAANKMKKYLKQLVNEKVLVDYKVIVAGDCLHIYTTRRNKTLNQDAMLVNNLLTFGFIDAIDEADNESRFFNKDLVAELKLMDYTQAVERMQIVATMKPLIFTNRKADPFAVFIAANADIGSHNLAIWEMLCNPNTNAGLTIDPAGNRGYLIEVWDRVDDVMYKFDSITENQKLRTLISEPHRYVIVAAYTKKEHKIPEGEPILAVSCKRIFDKKNQDVVDDNPVLIVRAQSGLPAWGEVLEAYTKASPLLTYGGNKHRVMQAMCPVTEEEAINGYIVVADREDPSITRNVELGKFIAPVVAFGYQSHQGRIGHNEPVVDKTVELVRQNSLKWDALWNSLPAYMYNALIEPLTRPHAFNRKDDNIQVQKKLAERFFATPGPVEDEAGNKKMEVMSPILTKKGLTASNIKVDIGSVPGHFKPHPSLFDGVEEVAKMAQEHGINFALKFLTEDAVQLYKELTARFKDGEEFTPEQWEEEFSNAMKAFIANNKPEKGDEKIADFRIWHAGDDIQFTIMHNLGAENPLIHRLAFHAFTYAADRNERSQVYGHKQDILLNKLVSGNVQGAGPGYAEINNLKITDRVVMLSADKTAPGAFTVPLLAYSRLAIDKGKFKNGLLAEIQDINNAKSIFLDLANDEDFQDAVTLLSAPEEFAIKRIWTTTQKWDRQSDARLVLDRVVAAASTERLVNVAGKYVGKDDPTMLIVISDDGFAEDDVIELYKNPILALGFMRGSHCGQLTPDVLGKALPNRFDGPPPLCGMIIDNLNGKAGSLAKARDAFKGKAWLKDIQEIANWTTEILRRQGFMPPGVVSGEDKEYTTAREVIAALKGERRHYPADNGVEEAYRWSAPGVINSQAITWLGQINPIADKAYSANKDLRSVISDNVITENLKKGYVFTEDIVFNYGLGALLPAIAKQVAEASKSKVTVIAPTGAQKQMIDKLNQGLDQESRIMAFDTASAAVEYLQEQSIHSIDYIAHENDNTKLNVPDGISLTRKAITNSILRMLGKIAKVSEQDYVEAFKQIHIILQQP